MTVPMFENEFGAVYADRLRLPAAPGDAATLDGEGLLPLSAVLRVAWLYDAQSRAKPGPLSKFQFWRSAVVAMSLLLMPGVNWWALSSPKWRVVVTLKTGGFVRSAHRDKWAKAAAFAKVARQAAKP